MCDRNPHEAKASQALADIPANSAKLGAHSRLFPKKRRLFAILPANWVCVRAISGRIHTRASAFEQRSSEPFHNEPVPWKFANAAAALSLLQPSVPGCRNCRQPRAFASLYWVPRPRGGRRRRRCRVISRQMGSRSGYFRPNVALIPAKIVKSSTILVDAFGLYRGRTTWLVEKRRSLTLLAGCPTRFSESFDSTNIWPYSRHLDTSNQRRRRVRTRAKALVHQPYKFSRYGFVILIAAFDGFLAQGNATSKRAGASIETF